MNKTRFKAGDRVRVIDPGQGNSVEVGDTGTVTGIEELGPDVQTLVTVSWDKERDRSWGIYAWRLEPITASPELHDALDALLEAKRAEAAAEENRRAALSRRTAAQARFDRALYEATKPTK